MTTSLVIFTSKQLDEILDLGGTGWWKVDPVKVRKASHVVLVHNSHDRLRAGDPARHGQSFLIATIRDLVQDEDGRWLIQFNKFAETNGGFTWPGFRNPVTYVESDELLKQLDIGEWQEMPTVDLEDAQKVRRLDEASVTRLEARKLAAANDSISPNAKMTFGQIIDHHRVLLAKDLGVEPGAVRISIEAV